MKHLMGFGNLKRRRRYMEEAAISSSSLIGHVILAEGRVDTTYILGFHFEILYKHWEHACMQLDHVQDRICLLTEF